MSESNNTGTLQNALLTTQHIAIKRGDLLIRIQKLCLIKIEQAATVDELETFQAVRYKEGELSLARQIVDLFIK